MVQNLKNLKLIPLAQAAHGSICRLVARKDVGLLMPFGRADSQTWAIVLNGSRSFQVTRWTNPRELVHVLCEPDQLMIDLVKEDESNNYSVAGSITVYQGGSILMSTSGNDYYGTGINLSDFRESEDSFVHGEFVAYKSWRIGSLDHSGEFAPLIEKL